MARTLGQKRWIHGGQMPLSVLFRVYCLLNLFFGELNANLTARMVFESFDQCASRSKLGLGIG